MAKNFNAISPRRRESRTERESGERERRKEKEEEKEKEKEKKRERKLEGPEKKLIKRSTLKVSKTFTSNSKGNLNNARRTDSLSSVSRTLTPFHSSPFPASR